MKHICLVGTGPRSRDQAPYDNPKAEIWTIARGRLIPPRVDRLFEMHVPTLWDGYGDREGKILYKDSLAAWSQCPIYMQEHYPEIPQSVEFPRADVLATVSTPHEEPCQTSQVSWQLALAIHEVRTDPDGGEIGLYGYDLISEGESRSYQRHAVEYYIGMARGMGIPVTVAEQSTLCRHRRDGKAVMYGYDYPLTRDEAVVVYGHPMRQVLTDKDGKPVNIRKVPGVLGMPVLGAEGNVEMKVVRQGDKHA